MAAGEVFNFPLERLGHEKFGLVARTCLRTGLLGHCKGFLSYFLVLDLGVPVGAFLCEWWGK